MASSYLSSLGFSELPQEFDERAALHPFVAVLEEVATELSSVQANPFGELPWDAEVPMEALRFLLHLISRQMGAQEP